MSEEVRDVCVVGTKERFAFVVVLLVELYFVAVVRVVAVVEVNSLRVMMCCGGCGGSGVLELLLKGISFCPRRQRVTVDMVVFWVVFRGLQDVFRTTTRARRGRLAQVGLRAYGKSVTGS